MRVMFAIFCNSKREASEILKKVMQINIKTVLMISINKNQTGQYPHKKIVINLLCEIKIQIDYMAKAITEKITSHNPLQYYYCDYHTEISN